MFCKECGRNIGEHYICPYCRTGQRAAAMQEFIDFDKYKPEACSRRSKYSAGFMQLFLGCFGAGRFYLGYKKIAVFQIIASFITLGIGGVVWGFVDGLMILDGREKYDGYGKLLK